MQRLAAAVFTKTLLQVIKRLGGPGLIVLGLVDNSLVPLPGSMDASTVLLAAAHHEPWWYYAMMATVGSLIGGYLTYRIGVRGGEETLHKRISKPRADQVYRIFRRFGFWSVSVTALTPPPMPIVPILIAAGALEYPRGRFLAALALGRSVRYTLLAYLGHVYGRSILGWLGRYYRPLLYALIGLAVLSALVSLGYWWRRNHKGRRPNHRMDKVA
ncbi:MAG TPA: VTT domain-containing protein [Terriglobales bacterium]|nr:VTT domain-containing protein [Terriglobales bacterium]